MNEEINVNKIIEEYAEMVNKIIYRSLNSKEDCEDLLQEVFVEYVRHIKLGYKFETEEHEKCWLIRVALNLCSNKIKYNKIRKTMPLKEDICYNNLDISFENNLFTSTNKLERKYKEVFELFYYDDLKVSEISKILKISEANVKTRLKRARDKLKIIMKKGERING